MSLCGGIEAGGTKFVCAVGTGPDDVRDEVRFSTTSPEECIRRSIEFFQAMQNTGGMTGNLDKDRDAIKDQLAKIKDFEGITGKRPGGAEGLVYSRFNGPNQEILENRLAIWEDALHAHRDEAIALQGQVVYDRFDKYLSGCQKYFASGHISVHQFTMTK